MLGNRILVLRRRSAHERAMAQKKSSGPDFSFEAAALSAGARCVAGVDEAGRGPLAGPVVAAAVVLDPDNLPAAVRDSKKLSARQRDAAFAQVMACARFVSVATAPPSEIDQHNILRATLRAMRRAVLALPQAADFVLIDGRDVPDIPCSGQAVIGGDDKVLSIAAASIVAKVMRDRMMASLHQHYPHYGFAQHMGYGTAAHRAAIAQHGPCAHHRFSFAPIKTARPQF